MDKIEQLAREYKHALEASSSDDTSVVEQIIVLEENQLDYLNALLQRVPPQARRTVNYLKNIVFRSLQKLNSILRNDSYVPSFRNVNIPNSSLIGAILSTQISIFVLFDKINLPFNDIAEILSLENRKLGFMTLL